MEYMELYSLKKVDSYHSPHKFCIAKYRDTGISYAYIQIYIKNNEQLLISIPILLGVLRPIHDSCMLPWCPSYQMSEIILCSVGKSLHLPLTLIKMVLK